jgi:hypothetical protein
MHAVHEKLLAAFHRLLWCWIAPSFVACGVRRAASDGWWLMEAAE